MKHRTNKVIRERVEKKAKYRQSGYRLVLMSNLINQKNKSNWLMVCTVYSCTHHTCMPVGIYTDVIVNHGIIFYLLAHNYIMLCFGFNIQSLHGKTG